MSSIIGHTSSLLIPLLNNPSTRLAAYVVAVSRVAEAVKLRGWV
jgi:glutamate dehydrogenase/leucine dehydrogenase